MKFDETKLREYLLDDLSSAETEEIEMFILENPDFETSLADAENELIEDFTDDSLTANERERFLKHFLTSARRREELEFLQALKKSQTVSLAVTPAEEKKSFLDSLRGFFRLTFVQFASASMAILIIAGGIWWFTANRQSELAREISILNEKNLSDLSAIQNLPTLTLIPGVFRGNESRQTLAKETAGETVLLRLALPGNYANKPTANLYRGDVPLAEIKNVSVYQNPAGSEIRLLLPAAKLEKGDYRLELQFDKEKTVYNFSLK